MKLAPLFLSLLLYGSHLNALKPTTEHTIDTTQQQATRSWLTKKNVAIGSAVVLGIALLWLRSAAKPSKRYQSPQRPEDVYNEVFPINFSGPILESIPGGKPVDITGPACTAFGPIDSVDNCIVGIARARALPRHMSVYVKKGGYLSVYCYTIAGFAEGSSQFVTPVTHCPDTAEHLAHHPITTYTLKERIKDGTVQLPTSFADRSEGDFSLATLAHIYVFSPLTMHVCRGPKEL